MKKELMNGELALNKNKIKNQEKSNFLIEK